MSKIRSRLLAKIARPSSASQRASKSSIKTKDSRNPNDAKLAVLWQQHESVLRPRFPPIAWLITPWIVRRLRRLENELNLNLLVIYKPSRVLWNLKPNPAVQSIKFILETRANFAQNLSAHWLCKACVIRAFSKPMALWPMSMASAGTDPCPARTIEVQTLRQTF